MKVFDRYLARNVTLPEVVEPGRYRLLKRTTLNGASVLESNDLLLSDGRERCVLDGEVHRFSDSACHGDDDSTASLILRSVQVLAQQYRSQPSSPPSPLIPPDLAKSVKLNELDEELRRVIDAGHLDEIARRPRFAMKYDAELTQIHRVRRMAPGAVDRLAAHSEDWHRRTLSGVLPARLLALLSDDDWSIYENKVFARLLDHLNNYLRKRLAETKKIHETYRQGENLKETEHVYFRLRDRLFALWGEAMGTSSTEQGLKESREAIKFLQSARRRVGLLRQGALYRKVQHSAHVPVQLRNTNILMHDQHYLHLRTLWRKYQVRSTEKEAGPQAVLADNRRALADFTAYLRMMIHRVISHMKLVEARHEIDAITFSFAETQGRVLFGEDELKIQFADRELVIVPAMAQPRYPSELRPDASGRIVIACLPASLSEPMQEHSAPESSNCVINPFDFYGEERLRLIVEPFLLFPAYAGYGCFIGPLPGHALEWLGSKAFGLVENQSWRPVVPPRAADKEALHSWLRGASLNDETKDRIRRAVAGLNVLSLCRHCGRTATFMARDGDFAASCDVCETEWGIYRRGARRAARMRPIPEQDASFGRLGSWLVEFEM